MIDINSPQTPSSPSPSRPPNTPYTPPSVPASSPPPPATPTPPPASPPPRPTPPAKLSSTVTIPGDSKKESGRAWYIAGGVLVGVIALAAGGVLAFKLMRPSTSQDLTARVVIPSPSLEPSPSTTPSASAEPTPLSSPSPSTSPFNTADWKIEVLNGTGEPGLAAKVAKTLKDRGYDVVKVGNADKQTYDTSELFVAAAKGDQQDQLLTDLQQDLPNLMSGGKLTGSTADARIIIGQDKSQKTPANP